MDYKKLSKIADKLQQASSQPICDMATVKIDSHHNCRLTVNPDLNRIGDEYFKFYNSAKRTKDEKVARILFRRCDYVYHNKGINAWLLNTIDKKLLKELLCSQISTKNGIKLSLWKYSIISYNEERFGLEESETMLNTKENGYPYPDALPIDLPMPDYMQL